MKNKTIYNRNHKGEYISGLTISRKFLAFVAFITFLALGTAYSMIFAPIANSKGSVIEFKEGSLKESFKCTETLKGFVCNDPSLISDYVRSVPPAYVGKKVRITAYSRLDSCHNKRGNECLTAIGRDTKEGVTVACPRAIKLGTPIWIEGIGKRICEDRTALWVENERGATFDIFYEDYSYAKQFGRKMLTVTVL